MKTINCLFAVLALFLLVSCEGEQGPPGVPGEDGLDGVNILGSIIEIEGTFSTDNSYKLYYKFPSDFEVYSSDVVLVYILWEQADVGNGNGNVLDVWRLLPQTVLLDEGILQYNFDYTTRDVQLYLTYTSDYNQLLPAETDNQVFRIAVLPADYLVGKSVDVNNLNAVMKSLKIDAASVKKLGTIH